MFKLINDIATTDLCKEVVALRDFGELYCSILELDPPLDGFTSNMTSKFNMDLSPILDVFVKQLGLNPLGPLGYSWVEVIEETGKWILECTLSEKLPFGGLFADRSVASRLVWDFLNIVQTSCENQRTRYFTNGELFRGPAFYDIHLNHILGYNSISDATFDTGAIVVTRKRIGILWTVEDD